MQGAGPLEWHAAQPTVADLACRAAYRLGYPLAVLWWRLRRPRHRGALVAVRVGTGLLLVRQSYRRGWTLPGGGVRPGEAPEAAARRELREELGLDAPALRPAAVVAGTWEGRQDEVHVFEWAPGRLPPLRLDGREIVEARLFAPEELRRLRLSGPAAIYTLGLEDNTSRRSNRVK